MWKNHQHKVINFSYQVAFKGRSRRRREIDVEEYDEETTKICKWRRLGIKSWWMMKPRKMWLSGKKICGEMSQQQAW